MFAQGRYMSATLLAEQDSHATATGLARIDAVIVVLHPQGCIMYHVLLGMFSFFCPVVLRCDQKCAYSER